MRGPAKTAPTRTPHLIPLPFYEGRGENTTVPVGRILSGMPSQGAAVSSPPPGDLEIARP